MADEPRRSGRSTKGQHKNLDMVADTPAKKSKAKKDKAAKASAEPTPGPDEEEEELIRCICGEYEEEEDVERDMICCDKCSAWQHNDCMGLTFAKGEEPDEYYCELCKPENHKELLDRMARGERPWEEVAERRRQEAEAMKATRRKKGKKGRRGRPSLPKPEVKVEVNRTPSAAAASPPSARAPSASTPGHDEKNGHLDGSQPSSNQKRKFDEHRESAQPEASPKVKQQKVTSPTHASTNKERKVYRGKEGSHAPDSRRGSGAERAATEEVGNLEDIANPGRRNAANALVKLFVDQLSDAQKRGSFSLPDGKPAEEVARRLGISIEREMYQNICGGAGEPTEPYKLQLRSVLFNVKKNASLRDRLLVGSLLPSDLSKMSSQDMASEELQQKDAEIKREAERQHIIIQEQGPRIRRTHKGEEFVEDDHHDAASESVFSAAQTRRSIAEDGSPHASASPTVQQQPFGEKPGKPQPVDTKLAGENSHNNHLDQNIRSPDGTGHDAVFPEVATHIREHLPTGKAQADAEIDHLLRDDEPDSPPYSPKDHHDEGVVWRGKLMMNSIAQFSSSAKHVGGADLSEKIPWSDLAPSTLLVDGRIDIQLASNYLCGLRFSSSTDVTVMAVSSPQVPAARASFDKLFNYFKERKRYGVIGKHPLPAVSDTYIVPVEAGSTKKPEFVELLENNSLEDTTPDRLLLVIFVVKTGNSNRSSAQPPSYHPSQEPPTPQQNQFISPGHQTGPQSAPDGMPAAQAAYSTPQQQPPMPQPTVPYQQYPPYNQVPLTGMAAAIQVLGPQANAPAIKQLVQQAPDVDFAQLSVVRNILQGRPEAAANYEILMQALYQAQTNGHDTQKSAG
ncbi:PHD finger domain protein [Aspergillus sclerotialis]|uniref:Transcription factor BYE1 n=1 Tax=Aspergillus sclerotialis TaxID=2070753 RepID=A0A3A2ZP34_9EURO|nr:PHD finger domain protein [Aspergillus sclerotialis]